MQFLDAHSACSFETLARLTAFNRSIERATSGEGEEECCRQASGGPAPALPLAQGSPCHLTSDQRSCCCCCSSPRAACVARTNSHDLLSVRHPPIHLSPARARSTPACYSTSPSGSPSSKHTRKQQAALSRARLPDRGHHSRRSSPRHTNAPSWSQTLQAPSPPDRPVLTRPTFRTTQRHVTRTTLDMMSIP